MLKFVADSNSGEALVGLGLSFENLRRLRQDAIQFFAEEVGLGPGLFIIAHASDPKLPFYQANVGELVRELMIWTESTCRAFQQRDLLVEVPLKATREGRACKALIFAGETEQVLLDAFKRQGLVTSATKITGPDPEPEVVRISQFPVSQLNLFKLGAGGLGFIAITLMLVFQRHHSDVDFLVYTLMIITSAVFFTLLYLRANERIEIDAQGIRRLRPLGAFSVPWSELASIQKQEDALGPYRLHFVTRAGRVHKLERIYGEWDDLIKEVLERRP